MNPTSVSHPKSCLLAALAVLLAATPTQAEVSVTNVAVAQRPGTKLMDITYDVTSTATTTVAVTLAVTNGPATVGASSLTGAVGPGVAIGTGKTIVWNAGADWSGNVAALNYTLTADDGVPDGFALIPAGSFEMGDQSSPLVGYSNELPVHSVSVSAFYMAKYEVTKELWDEVRAWGLTHGYTDLSAGKGKAATHPVQTITWYDMVKWCNARTEYDNATKGTTLTPCYTLSGSVYKATDDDAVVCNWSANGYRLPSEAEWEKAARGGVAGKNFPWGDTITHSQANYCVYSNDGTTNYYSYDVTPRPGYTTNYYYHPSYNNGVYPHTSPVGSFTANGYGLYDMAGNVWEWCWDWYGTYPSTSQTDPRGAAPGSIRVIRGGSWSGDAFITRCARRRIDWPSNAYNDGSGGFRVARGQ